jgi:hypothetical protein
MLSPLHKRFTSLLHANPQTLPLANKLIKDQNSVSVSCCIYSYNSLCEVAPGCPLSVSYYLFIQGETLWEIKAVRRIKTRLKSKNSHRTKRKRNSRRISCLLRKMPNQLIAVQNLLNLAYRICSVCEFNRRPKVRQNYFFCQASNMEALNVRAGDF